MRKRILAAAQAFLTAAAMLCGTVTAYAADETGAGLVVQKLVMVPDGGAVQGEAVRQVRSKKGIKKAGAVSPASVITLEGELPEGILGEAVTVDPADYIEPTDSCVYCAYDISLYRDELKYEPEGTSVTVSITADFPDSESGTGLRIIHIPDSPAEPAEYITDYYLEGSTVTFTAESFSVYLIAEDEGDVLVTPRRMYKFLGFDGLPYYFSTVNADGTLSQYKTDHQILKNGDTLQEPPVPEQDDTTGRFLGWYYANEDGSWLDNPPRRVQFGTVSVEPDDDHTIVYCAPLFEHYRYVVFHDLDGTSLLTKKMTVLTGNPLSAEVTLSDIRADDKDSSHLFAGWALDADGTQRCGDTLTLTESSPDITDVYPVFDEAHYIVFHKKNPKADYVDSLFVGANQQLSEIDFSHTVQALENYTFGGWYLDENCATQQVILPDGTLRPEYRNTTLSDTMNLYAKWTFNGEDAPYKVIYWVQSADSKDRPDTPDAEKTYAFHSARMMTGTPHTNTSAPQLSSVPAHYHYSWTNGPKDIEEDGTTVINMYYDLDTVTINFNLYGSHGAYITDSSNSNNPQKYGFVNGEYLPLTRDSGTLVYHYTPEYTYTLATYGGSGLQTYYYLDTTGEPGYTDQPVYSSIRLYYYEGTFYRNRSGIIIHRYSNPIDFDVYNRANGTTPYTGTRYRDTGSSFAAVEESNNSGTQYGNDGRAFVPLNRSSETLYKWYLPDGTEYTGTRYRMTNETDWYVMDTYTGLYGQTFADAGYRWPDEYDWYNSKSGNSPSGTRTTFLDIFSSDADSNYYGRTAESGNSEVQFFKQNTDESWNTDPDNKVATTGGTFNFTEKYQGFTLIGYQTGNSINWTSASAGDSVSNYGTLLKIRFKRNSYPFQFMDKDGNPLGDPIMIPYGATIYDYVKDDPRFAGYDFNDPEKNFDGWRADSMNTQDFDFNSQMLYLASGSLDVYPGWYVPKYRVVIYPDGGAFPDESNYSTFYNLTPNEHITKYSAVTKTFKEDPDGEYYYIYAYAEQGESLPEGLERIAKYTNDPTEIALYSDYIDMSKKYRPMEEEDGSYEFIDWYEMDPVTGEISEHPYNYGENIKHDTVLIAKWKHIGAKYQIIYQPVDSDGIGGQMPQMQDPQYSENGYQEGAEVILFPRPTGITPGYVFEYWQVDLDGDEDGPIYGPGETLIVSEDLANSHMKIKIKAVYVQEAASIHTQQRVSVWLHCNLPDEPADSQDAPANDPDHIDKTQLADIQVNQAIRISEIDSSAFEDAHPGYVLVGWSDVPLDVLEDSQIGDDGRPVEGVLQPGQHFFINGDKIGADLLNTNQTGYKQNVNDLYAVWISKPPAPTGVAQKAAPYTAMVILAAVTAAVVIKRRKGGDVDETSPL